MDRIARQILGSFGWLHYERVGTSFLLHDGERRMKIDIDVLPGRDAIPNAVNFEFIGYTERQADALLRQYLWSALLTEEGHASRLHEDWNE